MAVWPAEAPVQQAMMGVPESYTAPLLECGDCTCHDAPSAPPAPWLMGPQNMYEVGSSGRDGVHVPMPAELASHHAHAEWKQERCKTLREWGRKREYKMHRSPRCLMDQMVSGSGLFPLRLLENSWFLEHERHMIQRLESLLECTGHAHALARDMLAPIVYSIDVKIVLDNSGSMQLDMFGVPITYGGPSIESCNYQNEFALSKRLQEAVPAPWFSNWSTVYPPAVGSPSPGQRRWYFARDALRKWSSVFSIIGIDPWVYLLNPVGEGRVRCSEIERIFSRPPQGSTPMTEVLYTCLFDHKTDPIVREQHGSNDGLLHIMVLTDGEANNMTSFNTILDEIQNEAHGNVQVCLMGLSLVREDIEWFEDEECGDSRIRTVEPFEVETRQIQMKEVVKKEGGYNFDMHSYRVLVTNYFPADYDYDSPLQNFMHRLYITLHGKDRWWGIRFPPYYYLSQILCSACFVATCCHCAGTCQGHTCGKCHKTDLIDAIKCGEE